MPTESEVPRGFDLVHDAVPSDVWNMLETWLETDRFPANDDTEEEVSPIPWEVATENRRVAQFGFRYDYEHSYVDTEKTTLQIPSRLKLLLHGSIQAPDIEFDQCIINEYHQPDIIIPWHIDHEDFGPVVLVYTFGDDRPLNFRRAREDGAEGNFEYYTAYPRHRSRYILSGPARDQWEHSVPTGAGRRVSFTFRTNRTKR